MEDPIIGVDEFAQAMNCSRATLYRRIKAGVIPKPRRFMHSRRLGWYRSEVERAIRTAFQPQEMPKQLRDALGQFTE